MIRCIQRFGEQNLVERHIPRPVPDLGQFIQRPRQRDVLNQHVARSENRQRVLVDDAPSTNLHVTDRDVRCVPDKNATTQNRDSRRRSRVTGNLDVRVLDGHHVIESAGRCRPQIDRPGYVKDDPTIAFGQSLVQ